MAATATNRKNSPSIDAGELDKFRAMAEEWWDPDGKFRPLHKINPVRLKYIRDEACEHFDLDPATLTPFLGLTVLDVGCGGGLLCEPLARLGAAVTGIDAVSRNIEIAHVHAEASAVSIDYRMATVEELMDEDRQFDIVLNMEVIEHVADVGAFLGACGAVVGDGGLMFFSTLNRTAKAFALAIVGGEYILRWLPRGTHDWRKFVRPSEFTRGLAGAGIDVTGMTGVTYSPLTDQWSLNRRDLDVNYMGCGVKAP
ncbi:MAG: bifunctional 2-polyprenyl-6-hydroxyphenol methylase/3-demethylubiquinol 3-O-methyltransferase UbiG [Alphaproteobacteria bacterium]|nr:bifunctional 2-polyprenyl-6-hydroxyphenol methylase/3-demethylubiquinol 3-O-methyltransferase UbiG [Alphaproteobacteria bacterium]MCZ6586645.1 bifunctional 2-polyprenyl-6-hydroxyphenol methylase/3-demethylubiquinol 3-O-methyltransferase UbiG [Alphaproteobacteria bacterium]MCZ6845920.1 bifunctional 2-polyprenyl-6-hydroxyphenol methylase/3-demethylubiquinol 3-O-methyltransferase UbiG [Alphaproteobacteria bacterium]